VNEVTQTDETQLGSGTSVASSSCRALSSLRHRLVLVDGTSADEVLLAALEAVRPPTGL
jgi:hypothetical protein